MGILKKWNNKGGERYNFLDDVLVKVTNSIDRGLPWEQAFLEIKVILKANHNSQTTLFDTLEKQDSLKYSLLMGFLFQLGIGTAKDEKQAFEHWKKDRTPYGWTLVGNCYLQGR